MVLYEAIVLNKPIASTDIPTIKDFFDKYKGGTIVDNSISGIEKGIKLLIDNKVSKIDIDFDKYNKEILKQINGVLSNDKKNNK